MNFTVSGVEHVYPFNLLIGLDYVPNVTSGWQYGYNSDLTADVTENIWDFGGLYTYSTIADIDTISSSSVLDTQDIILQGMDENYNIITQRVTLNGTSKVTLDTPLLRIWNAYNDSETDLAGAVYIYVDGAITAGIPDVDTTIRAYIDNGNNTTLMMMRTIPAGYTGFMAQLDTTLGGRKSGYITIVRWQRKFGKTWQITSIRDLASTGTSVHHHGTTILKPIIEKTDVQLKVIGNAIGLTCGASAQIYLVKNH